MARLNEPPAPVDNFDILRRKFLRQNRDIARVNSNQSLRIRGLENECARLLSENLDLRGQVLRLEKEIEDDKSQRVADHALQIKERMEAQLVELGALLAGFGLEPPTKRQSPVTVRRTNKPAPVRLSLCIESTPPPNRRPPPLSPSEAESLAVQEGRLPPIYETKTFPRRTLGQDEILALQADDNKPAGSPELGPPPTSRMLRDDIQKTNATTSKPPVGIFDKAAPASKAKAVDGTKTQPKSRPTEEEPATRAQSAAPPATDATSTAKPNLAPEKKTTVLKTTVPPPSPAVSAVPMPTAANALSSATASKAGGKRKFAINDENAALRGIKAGNENNKPLPVTQKDQADRTVPVRELKNPRSIRSLVNNRKDVQEEPVEVKSAAPIRQPLAAKSTNKEISTPRKQAMSGKEKPKDNNNGLSAGKPAEATGRMRSRTKHTVAATISGVSPLETVDIHVDDKPTSTTASSEASRERKHVARPDSTHLDLDGAHLGEPDVNVACPSTPSTPPPPASATLSPQQMVIIRGEGRDTPPPADISSQGEVSRPSRRSRTSVSYAEPNLRDKMRRPTKQLFDAVAGEGKYVQRHSLQTQHSQDQDEFSEEGVSAPVSESIEPLTSATNHPLTADVSPGAEKTRKDAAGDEDPYEFTVSSSSALQEADEEAEDAAGRAKASSSSKKSSSKASSKGSRRSSSTAASREDDSSVADRHTRPSASRKRASMAAIKRGGSLLDSDEEDQADSSYEPPAAENTDAHDAEGRAASTRERISRRRSMML